MVTSLQITVAKIHQSLPEMKRNGNTVLSAISSEQLFDETSTPRAGTVLKQAEFIPGLIQQLQDKPKKVIDEFEVIREAGEGRILPSSSSRLTLFSSHQTGGD